MEWASFMLDVMYPVMIALFTLTAGAMLDLGRPAPALFCLVPMVLSGLCIRYRLKVARYYLGKRR